MPIDQFLLEILACPKCSSGLTPTSDQNGLICGTCACVYPVRDGIPVMLVKEAVPLAEWTSPQMKEQAGP